MKKENKMNMQQVEQSGEHILLKQSLSDSEITDDELVFNIQKGIDIWNSMTTLYFRKRRLIKNIVRKYTLNDPEEDLINETLESLYNAAMHFDFSRKTSFDTYARKWIKQSAFRYIERKSYGLHVPYYVQKKQKEYRRVMEELSEENKIAPTDEEVAKRMKVGVKAVKNIKAMICQPLFISLDAPLNAGTKMSVAESIPDHYDMEADVLERKAQTELWKYISSLLNETEYIIIVDFFRDKKADREIADELGMSESEVKTIRRKICAKLKKNKELLDY